MGNAVGCCSAPPQPEETVYRSTRGVAYNANLSLAQRMSREVAKSISAEVFRNSAAIWGRSSARSMEAGQEDPPSKRSSTASAGTRRSAAKRIRKDAAAPVPEDHVPDPDTYTVTVAEDLSSSSGLGSSPVDSSPFGEARPPSPSPSSGSQPRLPPPRKGAFDDNTPNTQIMSCFVSADAGISGSNRY